MSNPPQVREVLARLGRSWFVLTAREQKAILLVAALFTLGTLVRYWHICLR